MWGDDESDPETEPPIKTATAPPLATVNAVALESGGTLYLPPGPGGTDSATAMAAQCARWAALAVSSPRVSTAREQLRYERPPPWFRPPPAPYPYANTNAIGLPFERAFVRGYSGMGPGEKEAVDNFRARRLWDWYPYVEDLRQFATSVTHNMAPGVLYGVGPIAFRRFGAEQTYPRKLYFSSPSGFAKWYAENYGVEA